MRLDKFLLYTAIGSAVWTAIFVWIGFTVGDNLSAIDPYLHEITVGVVILVAAGIIWHVREPLAKLWRRKTTD
jgi:membrane protein DedA with SNARE-associated domain